MNLYNELTSEEAVAVSGGTFFDACYTVGYALGAAYQDVADFFKGMAESFK
jgi:hypothetical protein